MIFATLKDGKMLPCTNGRDDGSISKKEGIYFPLASHDKEHVLLLKRYCTYYNMFYRKNPCKDCNEHSAGCHAICPEYCAYADANRVENEKEYQIRLKASVHRNYILETCARMKRNK